MPCITFCVLFDRQFEGASESVGVSVCTVYTESMLCVCVCDAETGNVAREVKLSDP